MNFIKVENYSLKKHNTLRINAIAKYVFFPLNNEGLKEIYQNYSSKKIVILGNGSNILLSKDYYDEDYVFISFKFMNDIELFDSYIFCEAGASLSEVSWFALENGYKGFEFLEDVPGSIGGAVIMNAGTYNDNIGKLVDKITYYDIELNKIINESVTKNDFGRRNSKWKETKHIILSCNLKISDDQKVDNYEQIIDELLRIKKQRYLKQPRNYPNAGSVFKRPNLNGKDYYIWKIFDELNLRGYRKNGAMISEKHPGFIVNVDNAKADDILYLIDLAKEKVKSKFGIDLELEWKIIK